MRKIAVVGGTSALANYLIPALKKRYEVVSIGRKGCDVHCDLLDDLEPIAIPFETEVLIHIAASFKDKTDKDIIQTEETNSIGTLKVCIAAKKTGVKHIFLVSSIYSLLSPASLYYGIYSISKKHSEELAEYYCKQNNIQLTILRPSQIYDAEGLFRKSQPLLYVMAENAEKNQDIQIFGNNNAFRNYIYVEDLVKIIMFTIKEKIAGVYSSTYPNDIKLTDIADAAIHAFNSSSRIVFLKDKDDIPDNVFDNSKSVELYNKIGFYPAVDIDNGMKQISQYRKSLAK